MGIKISGGHVETNLEVDSRLIEKAKIFGDFFNARELSELEKLLEGLAHEQGRIKEQL
jgi:lipoate-protein ligase A